jgi:hypothetical protein
VDETLELEKYEKDREEEGKRVLKTLDPGYDAVPESAELNGMVRANAIKMVPNALNGMKLDMDNAAATVGERQQVRDKVLDLAGVVTYKDRAVAAGGLGEGFKLGAEAVEMALRTMGEVFGIQQEVRDASVIPDGAIKVRDRHGKPVGHEIEDGEVIDVLEDVEFKDCE